MRQTIWPGAVPLAMIIALPLEAQTGFGSGSGMLSPRLEYTLITTSSGNGPEERQWIQAVILWRSQRNRSLDTLVDPTAIRAASQTYRAAVRAAEDRGRTFLGFHANDVVAASEYDGATRQLFVYGRQYAVPVRDSILVVMVDSLDAARGAPTVAGSAYVRGTLPPEAWGKFWVSGDTAYHVLPRRKSEHLRELLRQSAVVRSFIDQ